MQINRDLEETKLCGTMTLDELKGYVVTHRA